MHEIRKEIKQFLSDENQKIPLIAFRYSRDNINEKTDVKFSRPMRAEIYVHLSGDGTFFIGDHMYKLTYGDILIYNKDEVHFSTIESNTVWERFVIFFMPEHFTFIRSINEELLSFFYQRENYEYNLISLPEQQRKRLIDLCFQTIEHDGESEFDIQLNLFTNFLQILKIVNQGYVRPAVEQPKTKTPKIIKDVIEYINRHFHEAITLEQMAKHFSISKSHLSSYFRKYIGVSPYEYLLNVRLEQAKRLLTHGGSITDVCYACGFSDYSHFIQFFKKRTGMTPHKYQKTHTQPL